MKTVLIVEPDNEMRELLEERVRGLQVEVLAVATGAQGLELAKGEIPKLILTELDLPDMSGFNFIEVIRTTQTTKSIPVIVLTGRTDADSTRRAEESGVQLYVRKPYRPKDLLENIQTFLNSKEPPPMKVVHQSRIYERLVVDQLEIEVRTPDYLMRGITTGINPNGLGARINILEQIGDDRPDGGNVAGATDGAGATGAAVLAAGQACTVQFRSSKYPLLSSTGTIIRIEASRDPRYQRFIAVKFEQEEVGGMDDGDKISLREWIQQQNDRRMEDSPSPKPR